MQLTILFLNYGILGLLYTSLFKHNYSNWSCKKPNVKGIWRSLRNLVTWLLIFLSLIQAWECAIFGEDEAVGDIHREKIGGKGIHVTETCNSLEGSFSFWDTVVKWSSNFSATFEMLSFILWKHLFHTSTISKHRMLFGCPFIHNLMDRWRVTTVLLLQFWFLGMVYYLFMFPLSLSSIITSLILIELLYAYWW